MRLLFLCKRRPQGKDLITRPYGRFFYLPYHLAQQGHEVTILLLGYDDEFPQHYSKYGIEWYTESLRPLSRTGGLRAYLKRATSLIEKHPPDWLIGFSDTWYGIIAVHLGAKYNIKTLIDAYDNYESYMPWAKPLHWIWRSTLGRATALSAAGPQLIELMSRNRSGEGQLVGVVPMAADPAFQPLHDTDLRDRLELPQGVPLLGYCGTFYRSRGIEVLFRALELLLVWAPEVKLVVSGRIEQGLEIPESIRHAVMLLGYLPDEQIPELINTLDVLLVINRASAFGNYSYPVKLYEAMQCCKPVIATDVGGTGWILKDHPECLVGEEDPEELARRLLDALSWKTKEYASSRDWSYSANVLHDLLDLF